MLRLAQKAFYPAPIPFPLLHVDTGFKFAEMLTFRDQMARSIGAELLVWRNEQAIAAGTNPIALDTKRCCGLLKTQALLDALRHYNFDAAFGGARRDEEKSRAKERIYSFRDSAGQWDPKNQRPELWNLYNARIHPGESIRVFPLSNWTEMDVWQYIHEEKIPVVDLYFAKERPMYVRGDELLPIEQSFVARLGEQPQMVKSRLRSLGCSPCTGAIRSDAETIPAIISELISFRSSERANRAIDHDQEGSMEIKKREGYF
jgi:sulfate adenylyltransferase subunit 2